MSGVFLVHRKFYAAVYDGSNAEDLVADIPGATLTSDNGTIAVININSNDYELPVGGSLIYQIAYPDNVQVQDILTDVSWTSFWVQFAPQSAPVQFGQHSVAAGGLLGQTQNVDVTLVGPMPSTAITPLAFMTTNTGVLGLAGHTISAVTVIDENTIRVTIVSAIGAAAGQVTVLAFTEE